MSDRIEPEQTGPRLFSQMGEDESAPKQSSLDSARIISADQQRKAFKRAQQHSRRVFFLKWSLPLIALSIVAGFVGWVSQNNPKEPEVEVALEAEGLKQDELVMQNPNLNGYTDGRSYEVSADQATQKVETPNVINLQTVKARITDEKQEWVTIDATTGVFDQQEETLGLDGDVKVDSSLGYKLHTDKVAVDMPKGYMETLSPVNIASRDIRLSADRLEAIDNGEQFRFSGRVRLYIDAALLNKPSASLSNPDQDVPQPSEREEDEPQ